MQLILVLASGTGSAAAPGSSPTISVQLVPLLVLSKMVPSSHVTSHTPAPFVAMSREGLFENAAWRSPLLLMVVPFTLRYPTPCLSGLMKTTLPLLSAARGGICPSRQSRRECKICCQLCKFLHFHSFFVFFLTKTVEIR